MWPVPTDRSRADAATYGDATGTDQERPPLRARVVPTTVTGVAGVVQHWGMPSLALYCFMGIALRMPDCAHEQDHHDVDGDA